ncbi:hypothetical protein [Sphingobacterium sp. DR205]|uniref:hypothetical protein n=1 Tax=Sphingobacterium sp. DR205 TaxID=2713573 RepID=UPI0013E45DE6|nr:hypothetical protein [Sphingobacterium sp. DR205]QIH35725.1 hypothetical protein G6053_23880 [Sphingobacterium sp. DR205]
MEEKEDNQIISTTEHLSRQKVSRIDFEILVRFYEICKKKKISEREVSFLMGKVNKYFSKILNPFFKEHIKTEYLDILPAIASTGIRKIIPNNLAPKETIDIHGIHDYYKDNFTELDYYKFTVTYKDGTTKNYRWKIEVKKGGRSKVNHELLEILKILVSRGYFNKPKFALTIYLLIKKNYKSAFTPLELQIALAKLTNKSTNPEFALEEGVDNMRITYKKILTETEKFLEHCQDNSIWISKYVPINSSEDQFFIWYEDTDENDKLLTTNDGKVLLSSSIDGLLKNSNNTFNTPVNLAAWLSRIGDLPPIESITYSPGEIIDGFAEEPISVSTLADFVNFFNVVGDLGCQDKRFEVLLEFREAGELTKVWDHYYNKHFFKTKKRKELSFDKAKFIVDFRELVGRFESTLGIKERN